MLTILALGLILFILGVGGTYVYDHQKEFLATYKVKREQEKVKRAEELAAKKEIIKKHIEQQKANYARKATNPSWIEDILDVTVNPTKRNSSVSNPKSNVSRRIVRPGNVKVGFHKPDDFPTESKNVEVTIEDLIKQLEARKKK